MVEKNQISVVPQDKVIRPKEAEKVMTPRPPKDPEEIILSEGRASIYKKDTKLRWLKILVVEDSKTKFNLSIPMPLITLLIASGLGLGKVALKFLPKETRDELEEKGINLDAIGEIKVGEIIDAFKLIKEHVPDGRFVDIEDDWGKTKVQMTIV